MSEDRYGSKLKQIEAAALEVFVESGYENTTLEAVADKLGYTKQSIYYYFKNKEELVLAFCREILVGARDDVLAICASGTPPDDRLTSLISFYLEMNREKKGFFALHRNLAGIMGGLSENPEKRDLLAMMKEIPDAILGIIREGIDAGVFRKEDPKLLSGMIFGLMSGVALADGLDSMRGFPYETTSALAAEIIMKGIRP